ncbi:MAG: GNAT family N-acetyltransferase [Sphaerospermopsis sp. SIO1G2]|nr:GNAT family N-acetyltransferase [Sphaerospermopsis sp. SIO1G1]NET72558.1 GNAT family N-acetyltransferase [Sphaerospermopsis sp. SIO1G2]
MKSWFLNSQHQPSPRDVRIANSCQFQIRTATSADLPSIAQIIAESFHSQTGLWGWAFPLFRLGIFEDLRYRFTTTKPDQIFLVAVDTSKGGGNKILATVEMSVRLSDSWVNIRKCFPYLSNLAVHPMYRRYGLGSSLLIRCEQVCKDWDFEDLYLHVLDNNHQAKQLYFKMGYQVEKVESCWDSFLFHNSRQILLHKHISAKPHVAADITRGC